MRLTEAEHASINLAVKGRDPDARVYLFGSRVDDRARGGDIDLMVLSGKISLSDRLDILVDLHRRLGERRIDLLVYPDLRRPFARIAATEGVLL